MLDLPLERTVGDIREDTSEKARANMLDPGVAKADLLDYEINSSVVEGRGIDLLAMGRPEGPGCYCAANTMLRTIVDRISGSYQWVVIDNEAGLEHLSRRTTRDVDVLLVVSDATVRGLTTAARIVELIDELKTQVGRHYLIVNRAPNGLTPELEQVISERGLNLLAVIPDDPVGRGLRRGRPGARRPAGRQRRRGRHRRHPRSRARRAGRRAPRAGPPRPTHRQGGLKPCCIIGENIHIIAPKVKDAIDRADKSAIQDMARRQVEAGAGILDLNIGPAAQARPRGHAVDRRDGAGGRRRTALARHHQPRRHGGRPEGLQTARAMLNSASADPARLDPVMALAAQYDARVIALTMGIDGIPTTADGRAGIAMESLLPAAEQHGIEPWPTCSSTRSC